MPDVSLVRGVPRKNIIPVVVAAKQIGMKVDTLEAWIKQGDCPFGVYIKKAGRTHGSFTIFRTRFEKYMAGGDMRPGAQEDGNETA